MILIRAGGLPFTVWQSLVSAGTLDSDAETAAMVAAKQVQEAFDEALATVPESDFRTALYNARKAFFQKQKMPPEQLLALITNRQTEPAFARLLRDLAAWSKLANWTQLFDIQYTTQLKSEWKSIQHAAMDTSFRRALLFASHDLFNRLPAFCAKTVEAFDKKDRQTAVSVLQYLSRSIFKTSPLGRFTAVQLWRLGQEQQEGFQTEKIAVTPSVAMLPALYEVLLREPAFYNSLEIGLNPCISTDCIADNPLSWLYFDGEQEAFQRMEGNPVVHWIVRYLLEHQRKCAYPSLLAQLSVEVDASPDRLEALLQELISVGLLEWQLPEMGLSPSWCSSLSQYLSFLPSAQVLTDAAFLLQYLRVSARAVPFQSPEEAQTTQKDAKLHLEAFFLKHDGVAPPIPAEQIFFEDMERSLPVHCPESAIRQLTGELAQCWKETAVHELPTFRSRLFHFTERRLEPGQVIDFQDYCSSFFATDTPAEPAYVRRFSGKIGALIQVYRHHDTYRAVVNALFPGGGKLFARWMHLFPADFRASLDAWSDPDAVLFPWQGWSNANFQQMEASRALHVPDGRVGGRSANKALVLGDMGVRRGEDGPELVEKTTGKVVILTDLGLESPESRTPMLQVLWHLGVPFVSSLSLAPSGQAWEPMAPGVRKRARMDYQSLTLSRASWVLLPSSWSELAGTHQQQAGRYRMLTKWLKQLDIPDFFFARLNEQRQKPQFFDQNSPVSMLLFEKVLGASTEQGVYIEEMLPTPAEWVLGASASFVGEFVVEFI